MNSKLLADYYIFLDLVFISVILKINKESTSLPINLKIKLCETNMKEKTYIILLLLLFFTSIICFNPSVSCTELELSQDGEINAGQQVINYFRGLFEEDWSNGYAYVPENDGLGFAASWERYGSSYEPFPKQDFVNKTMSITPILSPDNSETKIIELIDSAQQSLYIEFLYIYNTLTDLVDAIIAAKDRGVNCCVIFKETTDPKVTGTADALESAGITVKTIDGTSPQYFDLHNKGIIVDGKKVLISSINGSPTSLRDNRETAILIESEEVAGYYITLFNHDWNVADDYNLPGPSCASSDSNTNSIRLSTYINHFQAITYTGKMTVSCIAAPDNCYDLIASLINDAENSIDLSVYTLSQPYLLGIMLDRIAAGVKVRLLLENDTVNSYEKAYNRWSLYNLTVLGIPDKDDPSNYNTALGLWASEAFDFQHCKYCIIDNDTLIISSGNWARSSCPKPQDDGDVDGNWDWWFAIYGDGSGGPTEPTITIIDGFDISILIIISSLSIIAVYFNYYQKRKKF